MSDARPVVFRRVEDKANKEGAQVVSRPAWLSAEKHEIRPAPFLAAEDAVEPHPHAHHDGHEVAPEPRLIPDPHTLPLRSSIPARKSAFPPPVVISRLPPPPSVEHAQTSPEQEAFAEAALDLASLRARILSSVESEVLQLAVHIAQTIIEREVELDPSLYRTLAHTAVLALGDTQSARVRVSRAAYRAISELYGEASIDVDGVRVEVSMDASYDALSVVAEAGPSRVDSRLSERLSAVLRALEAEHRRNNAAMDTEETP